MGWFIAHMSQDDLSVLANSIDSGDVASVIERTYSLEEVPEALRYLGEGHARGRLVITV